MHFTIVTIYFSAAASRNLPDNIRKRIENEFRDPRQVEKSVKYVCYCIARPDYLTTCELSAVGSASDINVSFLNAMRHGI